MSRMVLVWGLVVGSSWAWSARAEDGSAASADKPASADKSASADQPTDEALIAADRSEIETLETRRSTDIMTREQLRQSSARSVPEALGETTGVSVAQTNRGAGSPILRGMIGPANLILVDGVRFNTSTFRTGPNQYLSLFDPSALARVEVIRGPSSVLYGNGAIGGVIALITHAPDFEKRADWGGSLSVTGATADNSPGGAMWLGAKADALILYGGGSFTRFGWLRDGAGVRQPLSDYRSGGWRAKAVLTPPRKSYTITAATFGNAVDHAGRVDQLGKGDVRLYDNLDVLSYVRLSAQPNGFLERLAFTVSHHRLTEHMERYRCALDDNDLVLSVSSCAALSQRALTERLRTNDRVDSLGADIDVGLGFWEGRLRITSGFEIYQDFIASSADAASATEQMAFVAAERGHFSDGSRYRTVGLFLSLDATVLKFGDKYGELQVSGGARLSSFTATAPQVPTLGDLRYSHQGFVGSAGLGYLLADKLTVYASFDQGFRAPNLQETTGLGDTGNDFEIPNDKLTPERSDTIELGAKLRLGKLGANGAWYYSFIQDAIIKQGASFEGQSVAFGKPVKQRVNAEQAQYQGVEGQLFAELWRLTPSVGVAWNQGNVETQEGRAPARRVPPFAGRGGLRYDHPDKLFYTEAFTLFAAAQDRLHPDDKTDLRICEQGDYTGVLQDPCQGSDPWFTLNLRGGVRINQAFRLDLAVYNLLDRRYETYGSGVYAPGLDARATFSAEF